MTSAVKVGGERLYKKAHRGEEVETPMREVVIYDLTLVGFDVESNTRISSLGSARARMCVVWPRISARPWVSVPTRPRSVARVSARFRLMTPPRPTPSNRAA